MNDKIAKLKGPEQGPLAGLPAKKLMILLHGVGANGNDVFNLVPHFAEALPDTAFFSPDAPFPCDLAPVGLQWFSLKDRREDILIKGLAMAAPYLNQCIDEKMQQYKLQDKDVILMGFSQGTMLALYTALRRKKPLGAVLGYSGALIGIRKLKDDLVSRPPVCLVHGEDDMVVPFLAFQEAVVALQQADFFIHAYSQENVGHGIDPAGLKVGIEFLQHIFSEATI